MLTAFPLFLHAGSQQQMLNDLETIKNAFKVSYAPAEWKNAFFGWDLDQEISVAKANILAVPGITTKDFQIILKRFLNTTKDHHVSVQYYSTEKATLPFYVRGVKDKYFISHIDREKLSYKAFPFSEGDEIVLFNGRPVGEVVDELISHETGSNEDTQRALAEISLTRRSGRTGQVVPKGTVTITILPTGAKKTRTYQLIWDYTGEKVSPLVKPKVTPSMIALSKSMKAPASLKSVQSPAVKKKIFEDQIFKKQMLLPFYSDLMVDEGDEFDEEDDDELNDGFIGARSSSLPILGRVWWESSKNSPFKAYLFELEDRQLIGYIRIPTFLPTSMKAVEEFEKIIELFEERSDALVIDQLDNPGGSLFYLYALASMLSDQALVTPKHRVTLTQADVLSANKLIPIFESITSDAEARLLLGKSFGGIPVTHQLSQFILNYFHFVNQEWNAGRQLTDPFYLYGIDHINPHPTVQYTKPILMLINHLCFSGGDFFPAILQDNQRAVLMGSRTAGAGGFITSISFPNLNGIAEVRFTGSIAERSDRSSLENLGVTPDIPYEITEDDLRNGYEDFAEAIRNVLIEMNSHKSS